MSKCCEKCYVPIDTDIRTNHQCECHLPQLGRDTWHEQLNEVLFSNENGALHLDGDGCNCYIEDEKIAAFVNSLLTTQRDDSYKEGARIQAEMDADTIAAQRATLLQEMVSEVEALKVRP